MRRNTKGKRVNERPQPYKPYEQQDYSKLQNELSRKNKRNRKGDRRK